MRALLLLALLLAGPAAADHDRLPLAPLPRLPLDPAVTVSGLSSGAFFAHQFHVAFSGTVAGAGIVAGGPYACPEQAPFWLSLNPMRRVVMALAVCSHKERAAFGFWTLWLPRAPDPDHSADAIRDEERRGAIDDPKNLAGARVWLFAGGLDEEVPRATVEAVRATYAQAGVPAGNIALEVDESANHGLPVAGAPLACGVAEPPFLVDCGFDAAGRLLAHLLPDGFDPAPRAPDPARFRRFDQRPFGAGAGLDDGGFLYLPQACETGPCRLHVVFHGCRQAAERLHLTFVTGSGHARFAEANRLVLLFPQVARSADNPLACWDWWGYTGADYMRRAGPQMRAVKAMVDALRAPP
ncbi:MAG TPA: PHB depolymerase family esterase [Beijerinckiaceae bacterium]|nr:PHB depolymerase family esterase [Beijerinckiaceae bacterium]